MADTFVSQPESSVTQVVFWKAYSAFVQQAMPDEPPVPASGTAGDVIKSATTVFPAANAMVINKDEKGQPLPQNLFVIAGMRFKRSAGESRPLVVVFHVVSSSLTIAHPPRQAVYTLLRVAGKVVASPTLIGTPRSYMLISKRNTVLSRHRLVDGIRVGARVAAPLISSRTSRLRSRPIVNPKSNGY